MFTFPNSQTENHFQERSDSVRAQMHFTSFFAQWVFRSVLVSSAISAIVESHTVQNQKKRKRKRVK